MFVVVVLSVALKWFYSWAAIAVMAATTAALPPPVGVEGVLRPDPDMVSNFECGPEKQQQLVLDQVQSSDRGLQETKTVVDQL